MKVWKKWHDTVTVSAQEGEVQNGGLFWACLTRPSSSCLTRTGLWMSAQALSAAV